MREAIDGRPYAGNQHVRFADREVVPAATPRRGSLLCKRLTIIAFALGALAALAMPTKKELSEAQSIVNELMKDHVIANKKGKESNEAVGDVAMSLVKDAESEAAKFVLLNGAVTYYARGKAYDKVVGAIENIMSEISDVPPETLNAIVSKAASNVNEKKAPRLVALKKAIGKRAKVVTDLKALEISLKKSPSDPSLKRIHAELVAATGNWEAALKEFAALGGTVGKLAEEEANGSAAAADFWWNYTPAAPEANDAIKEHAAKLYGKALETGELSGLKKTLAEKRIAEAMSGVHLFATSSNDAVGESQRILLALKQLGAKRVEYLGGTGNGSGYIDTGIVGNSKIKVDFEVSHWDADWFCFGARNASDNWNKSFTAGRISSSKMFFDYDSRRFTAIVNTDSTSRYRIVKDRQFNYCYDSKGVVIHSSANPPAKFNSGCNIYIFSANLGGSPKTNDGDFRRFYYFKIWDNDILVRDFIPVRVGPQDYLFDRVSLKLFGNSGKGAFVVGPDL